MLQDLDYGKMENTYRAETPADGDTVLCLRGETVLLRRAENDTLHLPTCGEVRTWAQAGAWQSWKAEPFQYLFCLQGVKYFLWMGEAGDGAPAPFAYAPTRTLRQLVSKNICFGVMTGLHLFRWYRDTRFCGRCGGKTEHDAVERMVRCPQCGNMIFPRIAPSVIIAVTDGDRLLLSKYANRSYTQYALLAGFTEIGETAEETVAREVMEEVGLRVKNIRYYKSQPWGVDGNLLLGYFCDLDGADAVTLDKTELAMAEWFDRDALPAHDDGISLTREMVRVFEEGREPKA